jgi:hypothetical protein
MKYDDMDELERETALKVWREVTGGSPVGASMADLERASETVLWHRWVLAEGSEMSDTVAHRRAEPGRCDASTAEAAGAVVGRTPDPLILHPRP